jgi:hypothetical protein
MVLAHAATIKFNSRLSTYLGLRLVVELFGWWVDWLAGWLVGWLVEESGG